MPNNPYGYMQQWNFDIQHQIAGSLLFDIAYAGAKGTHLSQSSQFINQLPDQNLSLGTALVQPVVNPFYGKVNSTSSLANPTISMGQLLLPYPQYTGLNIGGSGFGGSSYHSLQVKAQKRFHERQHLFGCIHVFEADKQCRRSHGLARKRHRRHRRRSELEQPSRRAIDFRGRHPAAARCQLRPGYSDRTWQTVFWRMLKALQDRRSADGA